MHTQYRTIAHSKASGYRKITIKRKIHNSTNPFVQITNTIAQDNTLSEGVHRMLTYLLSRPSDWEISSADLRNNCFCNRGRDYVRKVLRQAIDAGYLKRTIGKRPAGWGGWIKTYSYELSEDAEFKNVSPWKSTETCNPSTLLILNSPLKKENNIKKEIPPLAAQSSQAPPPSFLALEWKETPSVICLPMQPPQVVAESVPTQKPEEVPMPDLPEVPHVPDPKPHKPKKKKTEVAPRVWLTDEQQKDILTRCQEDPEKVQRVYTRLSSWKLKKDVVRMDDYSNIIRWVFDAALNEQQETKEQRIRRDKSLCQQIENHLSDPASAGRLGVDIGPTYIGFSYGPMCYEHVEVGRKDFKEVVIKHLEKKGLNVHLRL